MDEGIFDIGWEPATTTLVIRLGGFWTEEIYENYVRDLARVTGTIRCRYSVILDITKSAVQTQATIAGHEKIKEERRAEIIRMAIVGSGAITQMQAKRAIHNLETRFFPTEAEAREWIAQSQGDV